MDWGHAGFVWGCLASSSSIQLSRADKPFRQQTVDPRPMVPYEAQAFVLNQFKPTVEAELKLLVVGCEEETA
jgi:hypothetical protein